MACLPVMPMNQQMTVPVHNSPYPPVASKTHHLTFTSSPLGAPQDGFLGISLKTHVLDIALYPLTLFVVLPEHRNTYVLLGCVRQDTCLKSVLQFLAFNADYQLFMTKCWFHRPREARVGQISCWNEPAWEDTRPVWRWVGTFTFTSRLRESSLNHAHIAQ